MHVVRFASHASRVRAAIGVQVPRHCVTQAGSAPEADGQPVGSGLLQKQLVSQSAAQKVSIVDVDAPAVEAAGPLVDASPPVGTDDEVEDVPHATMTTLSVTHESRTRNRRAIAPY